MGFVTCPLLQPTDNPLEINAIMISDSDFADVKSQKNFNVQVRLYLNDK
jgi:hypothetical protein